MDKALDTVEEEYNAILTYKRQTNRSIVEGTNNDIL